MSEVVKIVFDIDTVNKLPVYPFGLDDINQNPYACILLDNELMNLKENCVLLEQFNKIINSIKNLDKTNIFEQPKKQNLWTRIKKVLMNI